MAAELGHEPSRAYFDQKGNLHLNGASLFDANEIDQATALAAVGVGNAVAAATSGVMIGSGTTTLDGSNPTDIVTGLTTITGAVACFAGNTVLGDDPNSLTVSWSGGTLSITAGKNASGTDPTQVASTDSSRVVSWIAVGT
jgi:hypothetical protein